MFNVLLEMSSRVSFRDVRRNGYGCALHLGAEPELLSGGEPLRDPVGSSYDVHAKLPDLEIPETPDFHGCTLPLFIRRSVNKSSVHLPENRAPNTAFLSPWSS